MHHGLSGARACAARRDRLRAGSAVRLRRHPKILSSGGRRRGARRRGRQDHLHHGRHRTAHERQLRGRHGRVHRPDGDPPQRFRGGAGRARVEGGARLSHRFPLRRVRKIGYPAPSQPGGEQSGYRRFHLAGGRRSDGRRACAGAQDQGHGALSGRAFILFERASEGVPRDVEARRRACHLPRQCALLHVHRRGALRGRGEGGKTLFYHGAHRKRQVRQRHHGGRTALCLPQGVRRIHHAPYAQRSFLRGHPFLPRGCVPRHRFGLDDDQAHAHHARVQNSVFPLSVQQRSAARYRRQQIKGALLADGRQDRHPRRVRHGIRRGYDARGFEDRFRRRRDDGALQGGALLQSRCRLYHRHRRAGHQVLQGEEPRHRLHHAQRGVLLGLRLLHPDVCKGDGDGDRRILPPRAVCTASRRTRFALHGVHEQLCQAGAEGGRDRRGYFGGALFLHRQECDL